MAKGWSSAMRAVSRKGYWRESDARPVVEAWRMSGQSVEEFATMHGLGARRLRRWAKRLGQARARISEPSAKLALMKLRFHPVEVVGGERPARSSAMVIERADEWRVRVPAGFAAEDLERVLQVLSGRDRC